MSKKKIPREVGQGGISSRACEFATLRGGASMCHGMLDACASGRVTSPAGSSFLPKEGIFVRDFLRLFLLPQNYVSAKDSLSGM